MSLRLNRRTLLLSASRAGTLAALSSWVDLANSGQGLPGKRVPAIFIGHGSPMNALQDNEFTQALGRWGSALGRPSAILSVSAHWLTPGLTAVGIQEQPKTIHDFGGFPPALQQMTYPARGAPVIARQAAAALRSVAALTTDEWGLDHGTWTVLHHLFPKADIPVFQMSIDYAQSGPFHYTLGQELAALRSKGVLVLGSGNVVHNLRMTDPQAPPALNASRPWAKSFDSAVKQALARRDDQALIDYASLDNAARFAVATPDHYWPLLYALGAADRTEKPVTTFEGFQSGTISMRCVQWGA